MRPATLSRRNDETMIPPLKTGATLPQPGWPGIETERLILRQWRDADIAANAAMLGDPLSARASSPRTASP
jgi:RimJ/RimL family protein N-acetyltransferase